MVQFATLLDLHSDPAKDGAGDRTPVIDGADTEEMENTD